MKELTVTEIKQVNGGFAPLAIYLVGQAAAIYSMYKTAEALGE